MKKLFNISDFQLPSKRLDMQSGFLSVKQKVISVLIAEERALVRQALSTLIETWPDMRVIAEVDNTLQAWEKTSILLPRVMLLDTKLSGLTTAQYTQQFIEKTLEHTSDLRILMLSSYEDDVEMQQLMASGAAGYFLKTSNAEELANAIRVTAKGDIYIDPNLKKNPIGQLSVLRSHEDLLSKREIWILQLAAYGYSNIEIARQLQISGKTIEGYKARIAEKMEFDSRVDWVRYAIRRGLVSAETGALKNDGDD